MIEIKTFIKCKQMRPHPLFFIFIINKVTSPLWMLKNFQDEHPKIPFTQCKRFSRGKRRY